LCRESGITIIVVDLRQVLLQPNFDDAIRTIFREAVLQPGAIYVEHFDLLTANDDDVVSRRQRLIEGLQEFSWLTFLSTEKAWEPAGRLSNHLYIGVELPAPDMQERADLWPRLAGSREEFAADVSWRSSFV
jgi:hypothetical protein